MFILLILACASAGPLTSTILYRDDGEFVNCPAESREAHDACVRDHKSLGFREMPEAYWGIGFAKDPPLRVALVVAGSPAALSGILGGDLVLELDGQAVWRVADVIAVVEKKRPGDALRATIVRDGNTLSVESTLAERPRRQGASAP